jgi:predicted DsbA family dithiol-disulfide isomerase
MNVEVFLDVVCPWCYIGERRFEQARTKLANEIQLDVTYRSFQLDPNASLTPRPLREYLRQRFGAVAGAMQEQVSQAGRSVGIEFDWDRALAVNTRTAHRLLLLARQEVDHVIQRAVLDALFAAHFTRGLDISDIPTLTQIAESHGMNGDRVHDYLASTEGTEQLERELTEARALGIHGVPAFVIDRKHMIEGAQTPATFERVLRGLREAAA